jgi:cytochrome b subunit of formate dehydrogenase
VSSPDRIVRHHLSDRVFHWVQALCIFILLGTSLLPVMGLQFSWVTIHWVAGVVLTVAVLFHAIRASFWQSLGSMWISLRDIQTLWRGRELKSGKYSLAQKSVHHAATVITLVAVVTGFIMMVGIDGPFWERNPYFVSAETRGVIYVLHGFTALFFVTMIIVHVYFGLRPEKLHFTRAMIKGWITRQEYQDNHDPEHWPDPERAPGS